MKFKSYNRYIVIDLVEDEPEKSKSLVVLPTDYKKPEKPYALGKVIGVADNTNLNVEIGETIIFEKRMLNKIQLDEETYYLVLENYIYGRI